jgi:hypothetical protein
MSSGREMPFGLYSEVLFAVAEIAEIFPAHLLDSRSMQIVVVVLFCKFGIVFEVRNEINFFLNRCTAAVSCLRQS